MIYPSQAIAAWDVFRSRWLYYDSETEAFTLLEIQPGRLMRVSETPIKFVHNRILGD
jgi:hypothetical protein